ncbi:hypothetical protein PCK1_003174, partial [Pneumocystis canis]
MNTPLNSVSENVSDSSLKPFLSTEDIKERSLPLSVPREKMQFLKKKEGESLLRRDIQYAFLDLVVNNDQEVFTLPHGAIHKKVTFGELYV